MKRGSFQEHQDGSKMDEGEEGLGEFVISGCHAAELLDFLPEGFDQMPLLVRPPIAFALHIVGLTAGNIGDGSLRNQPVRKRFAVISLVRVDQCAVERQGAQQRLGMRDVSLVSRRQQQANRVSHAVDNTVYLRRQPAS